MSLLKFKQWNSLNEASLADKLKNWLSGNLWGKVHKLDNLLSDYKTAELKYVDGWEEIKIEIDKLNLKRSQISSDPAEIKTIERMIDRNNSLLATSTKAHKAKTDNIFLRAKKEIDDNKRLKDYWEVNKTRIDAEVAEDMYNRAKDLTSDSSSRELYSDYKRTALEAKEKNRRFKDLYGDFLPVRSSDRSPFPYSSMLPIDDYSGGIEARFDLLSKLTITEFAEVVKGFTSEQAKKLASFLINERNDKYVALDMERDLLNTEIDKNPDDKGKREYAAKRIKEIREKYMAEIRDLRSKITIAKRYA